MGHKINKVTIVGQHDGKTISQLYEASSATERIAIMADGHLGYYLPIGGVAAYNNKVSPAGVGYDIACGNAAARTTVRLDDLTEEYLQSLGEEIFNDIHFGLKRGQVNPHPNAPNDHALFKSSRWNIIPKEDRTALKQKARNQLGTIGSGNHYVDILVDEEGYIWVGVHFGSRGFGHTVARNFMRIASGGSWGEGKAKEGGYLLDLNEASGDDYWNLMSLAGEYAYAGRDWVVSTVVDMLGAEEVTHYVHNHHNFAWEEEHVGVDDGVYKYVVVRKGATPAFPNQEGFVGGSMGDCAVILKGANTLVPEELEAQRNMMFSTVHGAGRVMSRSQAKREVNQTEVDAWLQEFGVLTFGGGLDESPFAYRRLPEVLEQQGNTIEVLHTLKPLIVCMA